MHLVDSIKLISSYSAESTEIAIKQITEITIMDEFGIYPYLYPSAQVYVTVDWYVFVSRV